MEVLLCQQSFQSRTFYNGPYTRARSRDRRYGSLSRNSRSSYRRSSWWLETKTFPCRRSLFLKRVVPTAGRVKSRRQSIRHWPIFLRPHKWAVDIAPEKSRWPNSRLRRRREPSRTPSCASAAADKRADTPKSRSSKRFETYGESIVHV
jgi:hypothetical protein